jgi:bacterioferritin-associated ferredoxin
MAYHSQIQFVRRLRRSERMFVCLCTGATTQAVHDAVAAGATTSRQVADACGAGSDCGRCRRTVRAILAASRTAVDCPVHAVR